MRGTRELNRRRYFPRPARALILIIVFYLIQVCIVPYFEPFGISPNLLMVIIAILTVSFGKKYAFVSSAIIGILLESMLQNLRSFYVLIYPTLALIFAQVFADMTEMQREIKRINITKNDHGSAHATGRFGQKKRFILRFKRNTADDLNPHLRILLNAICLTASFHMIMLAYHILNGVNIQFYHIVNILSSTFYTAICSLLMFPVRFMLGMYPKKKRTGVGRELTQDQENFSPKDFTMLTVIPEEPSVDALYTFELRRDGVPQKINISPLPTDEKEELAPPDPKESSISQGSDLPPKSMLQFLNSLFKRKEKKQHENREIDEQ